jgi:hypothetical protein
MRLRRRALEVREDLRNDLGLLDAGDDSELPAAALARVDLVAELRTCIEPGSKYSIAANRSNPASAGSQVSAQFPTKSPNRTRFQPVRPKSRSVAQAELEWDLARDGRVAVCVSSTLAPLPSGEDLQC